MGGWDINTRLAAAGWYLILAATLRMEWPRTGLEILVMVFLIAFYAAIASFYAKTRHISTVIDSALEKAPSLHDNAIIFTANISMLGEIDANEISLTGSDKAYMRDSGNALAVRNKSRCVIDLNNYEAVHDLFPLRFKTSERLIPDWGMPLYSEREKKHYELTVDFAAFDLPGYSRKTGIMVDYLLIFGKEETLMKNVRKNPGLYERGLPVFKAKIDALTSDGYKEIYHYPFNGPPLLQIVKRK